MTTSAGHPWPDQDVTHTYRDPGTYRITLTAIELHAHLVADDCTTHPNGVGC